VITNKSHKKVVELIKAISNETKLLVFREKADIREDKDSNGNAASTTTMTTTSANELNLNMTASELRAKLAARKKHDPKNDHIDIQKKYEIIDTM
jgi:DNA-binding transcriptional ArsR family regulator